MNDYTGLLFARPSFLEGVARTLDLGGTFTQYNTQPTAYIADAAAVRSDWHAVGEDLRKAMREFAAQFDLPLEDIE